MVALQQVAFLRAIMTLTVVQARRPAQLAPA